MPQPFLVTPGSELVKQTIKRDGFMKAFEEVGAVVLAICLWSLHWTVAKRNQERSNKLTSLIVLIETLKAEMMLTLILCLSLEVHPLLWL